jgi:hypothetical protein
MLSAMSALIIIGQRCVRRKSMGRATSYIDKLKKGETVQFRPRGNSMSGKIESGKLTSNHNGAMGLGQLDQLLTINN